MKIKNFEPRKAKLEIEFNFSEYLCQLIKHHFEVEIVAFIPGQGIDPPEVVLKAQCRRCGRVGDRKTFNCARDRKDEAEFKKKWHNKRSRL